MNRNLEVKKGDIIYVDLGDVIGSEQGGVRPCLVVQNDVGNRYSSTTIVAPITSKIGKRPLPTHVLVSPEDTGLPKPSVVLMEQTRTIDKSRICGVIGRVGANLLVKMNAALLINFGIKATLEPAMVS